MKKGLIIFLFGILLISFANASDCGDADSNTWCVELTDTIVDGDTFCGGVCDGNDEIRVIAGNRAPLTFRDLKGSAGNSVLIINNGGQVDMNCNGNWVGIWFRNSEYIHLSGTGSSDKYGFKIYNGSNQGVFGQELTQYIEIDHIEIYNVAIGYSVKTHDDINDNPILRGEWVQHNTTIHDSYIHDINGECIYLGDSHWNVDNKPELNGVYVYNNRLDRCGYDGIQVGSAPIDVEVHHNVITNTGWLDGGDFPTGANGKTGIMVNRGSTGNYYNNIILNTGHRGMYIQGVGGYNVYNNLIAGTGYNELVLSDGIAWAMAGNGNIYYNTIVNTTKTGIVVNSGTSTGSIHNNIVAGYGTGYLAISNNLVTKINNIETNDINSVGFVDVTNNDFSLFEISSAVNAGGANYPSTDIDGISRPQGSAPDIGAYEFVSGVIPEENFYPENFVEAEDGVITSPMTIRTDATASGGEYVSTNTANSGSAVYTFDVAEAGNYLIEARIISPTTDSNSFYVGLDTENAQGDDTYVWDPFVTTSWTWVNVTKRGSGTTTNNEFNPMIWSLSSGEHTFTFYGRESGTLIDRIILKKVISGTSTNCGNADSNSDGVVNISELMNYISQWKAGTVLIGNLMTAIGEWKNGCH